MSYDPATVTFELSGDEAWALAQFVVRVGWEVPSTRGRLRKRKIKHAKPVAAVVAA